MVWKAQLIICFSLRFFFLLFLSIKNIFVLLSLRFVSPAAPSLNNCFPFPSLWELPPPLETALLSTSSSTFHLHPVTGSVGSLSSPASTLTSPPDSVCSAQQASAHQESSWQWRESSDYFKCFQKSNNYHTWTWLKWHEPWHLARSPSACPSCWSGVLNLKVKN